MNDSLNLKFDPINMDTKLALEYFKKHNNEFRTTIPNSSSGDNNSVTDGYNKIFFSLDYPKELLGGIFKGEKLVQLAKKIEENAQLFTQMEYVIRKADPNDLMTIDIPMVIENLLYMSTEKSYYDVKVAGDLLMMDDNTPFYQLGFAAHLLMVVDTVFISSERNTTAISNLFTELCTEVGLSVVLLPRPNIYDYWSWIVQEGCTGVVTENSDLDSAVEAFLSSSVKYPWKLSRIFVQENIYDDFKKCVEWKCRVKSDVVHELDSIRETSAGVFVYGDHVITFDYVGDSEVSIENLIRVEAYRTTKEVLTLIRSAKTLYLSVWSSDISESNQIAHAAESSIVWINDIGKIRGPKVTNYVYSSAFICDAYIKENEDLSKHQKSWVKLNISDRRDKVIDALSKIDDEHFRDMVKEEILDWKLATFADVASDNVCLGIEKPIGVHSVNLKGIGNEGIKIILKSLVCGNAILASGNTENCDILEVFSVNHPVRILEENPTFAEQKSLYKLFKNKFIYTNFGTIFAN